MLWDPKILSLVVLTLQNTTLVLTMRISRTRQDVPMYLSSVAVMTDELMKLVVCTVMLLLAYRSVTRSGGYMPVKQIDGAPELEHARSSMSSLPTGGRMTIGGFFEFFKKEVFKSPFDFFKMSVPAILYALQKNLLYLAISNLDAAVFQVAYQGKILTTALFSVIVLGKKLNRRQIVALVILLVGVALVQLSSLDSGSTADQTTSASGGVVVGSIAVTAACFTSGFAAIYFEWVLKRSTPSQDAYALWVRNFQLATFASFSAGFGVWTKDGAAVQASGLYQGFTPLVWFVVATEAFGGIVVALVIKYADNILKNFATAVSIVTSVIISATFLNFQVKPIFVIGAVCVMSAVALYTSDPKVPLPVWPGARGKPGDAEMVPVPSPATNAILKTRSKAPPSEKAEI